MTKNIFLSVIIPSYNETENLKRGVLDEVNNYLAKQKYSWQVIVSDDGSPDEEARALARDFCARHQGFTFLENSHAGKPFAVWAGIQKARGKIILFTDMDQSTPINEVEKLLPYYDRGYDTVIGSRGLARKNFSLFRQLASTVFREIRRAILLHNVVDTQAGFKSMKAAVAKEIFPLLSVIHNKTGEERGWTVTSFDVELLVAGERRGYRIAEVPIAWEDRDISLGKSRGGAKFLKESLEMLQEIFRVKLNDLRGVYDKK